MRNIIKSNVEAEGLNKKCRHEIQLINFMTTVHEDARLHLEGATTEKLPERTLSLIQQKDSGLNL